MSSDPLPTGVENRTEYELRGLISFASQLAAQSQKPSWVCIQNTYSDLIKILREGRDITVSGELLRTFESNKRVIEGIYNPARKTSKLAAPFKAYLDKLLALKKKAMPRSAENTAREETDDQLRERYVDFMRQFVIQKIDDPRAALLITISVLYRHLVTLSTQELRGVVSQLADQLDRLDARPDRSISLLIYNLCQSSVNAVGATDYAASVLLCERAVELFKMIPREAKVKEELRSQIEESMRITTERLVNRIQEKEQDEEVVIIEDVVARLFNIDLIAYLLPQLVFFLIRAQKYEECLGYLDRVLLAGDLSGDFMDYQTATTIGHYWCDSLLKAERYSRGQVTFSFIDREKENIHRVFELSKNIRIPAMEDETFYNVEVEKLAVTFSHLGTLFFQTGDVEKASESYAMSFETILLKRCSRNRDSVDEILDRYKDTLFHPLNSAPPEAHSLIGVYASDKGYDFLLEAQLKRMEREGLPTDRDEQNFETLINPQKQLIADLMDSTRNKLKHKFAEPFAPFKPFIVEKFTHVKDKMQIQL